MNKTPVIVKLPSRILAEGEVLTSRPIAVFDLDGCVFDDEWRLPLIDAAMAHCDAKYAVYHEGIPKDDVLPVGADILRACLQNEVFPVFITARPALYRVETTAHLAKHFGLISGANQFVLLMRENGETTDTVDVKRRLVQGVMSECENRGYYIAGAFDDRLDVIEMYRHLKIPAAILDHSGLHPFERITAGQAFEMCVGMDFTKTEPRQIKVSESTKIETATVGNLSHSTSVHEVKYAESLRDTIGLDADFAKRDALRVAATAPVSGSMGIDISKLGYSDVDTTRMYDDPNNAKVAAQQSPPSHPVAVALRRDASMFEQRNALWKSNHAQVGAIMQILYPEGFDLTTPEAHQKYHILSQVVGKLSRFAVSGNTSQDSLQDMRVYAAILEDLTFNKPAIESDEKLHGGGF